MKSAFQNEYEVLLWKNGHSVPDNLTGHIIVFTDPLVVEQNIQKEEFDTKDEHKSIKLAKCHFMRAEGGFGCYKQCSGRMIIGDFFKSIEDVVHNKPFNHGNTKCFPDGYIPKFFTEHEKL